jgi:hypothetical protein
MTNSEDEGSADQVGISDDQLPEDLQPSEDNPLAEGLADGETVDDLLDGGKGAEETDGEAADDHSDDSDTESDSGAS